MDTDPPQQNAQSVMAGLLGVLVVWASFQLGPALGLPSALTGAAGGLLAVSILGYHVRERRGPSPIGEGDSEPGGRVLPVSTARWLLAGLVVAALALRLHTLMDRPAWADEMWTLRNTYTSSWTELLRVAFDDYWPPLHYILLNAITRVADTGLLWLRLPSVIFGTATVAALYPLGRELFRSRVAALFSAALLAGMTTHVLYSQEARVYAMQVFFAVLSAHYFFRSYWERRISPAYLVSTSLLTYSHSFASWYFIAAQSAYVCTAWLIWRDGKAFLRGLQSQLLVLGLWLPLVGAFVYSRFARDIVVPTQWATAPDGLPGPFDLVVQYQGLAIRSWAGAGFMALLWGLALWLLVRRLRGEEGGADPGEYAVRPPGAAGLFVLHWVVVPVVFSLSVSLATSLKTFGEIRYHMAVVPGLCLLAGYGFLALRSRAAVGLAALLAILLPAAELEDHYRTFQRPAIDEAAAIVREAGEPDEEIFVGDGFRAFAYYFRGSFPRIGSPEWDRLARSNADLTDRFVFRWSTKWGDSYAYEKLSRRITYMSAPDAPPEVFAGIVETQRLRGAFENPFWVVGPGEGELGHRHPFLTALADAGIPCPPEEVWHVRDVEIRRCPGSGARGSGAGSDPAPARAVSGTVR